MVARYPDWIIISKIAIHSGLAWTRLKWFGKKLPLPLLRNSVDWIIAHTVLVCVLLNTENSCLSISVQSDVSSLNASYPNVSVNQTRHALDTLTNKYAL